MAALNMQRGTFLQRTLSTVGLCSLAYYLIFVFSWDGVRDPTRPGQNAYHVPPTDFPSIMNSTLGFQKLMVINMPARTDRRDATSLAAAISGLEIEFVEGVSGNSVPDESLPPGGSGESVKMSKGIRGSWRSHMNALHRIVHENLTTALIFEDDVDWDIRLRAQLRVFAEASQFLTSTPSGSGGTSSGSGSLNTYPVLTIPNPETVESIHNETSPHPISRTLFSLPLPNIHHHGHSASSPYGDPRNWDVLWLGHCGAGFPRFPQSQENEMPNKANVVVTNPNDVTVPLPKYLRAHPFGPLDVLGTSHPPHTRVYHRASGGALCTIAYAVSQRGARRLLQEYSLTSWKNLWDAELGEWCAGNDFDFFPPAKEKSDAEKEYLKMEEKDRMERRKWGERVCVTSQPPVFAHHHPDGGESNIGGLGGGYARGVQTTYVRWSVRMNLKKLVRGWIGRGEELVDQWPD